MRPIAPRLLACLWLAMLPFVVPAQPIEGEETLDATEIRRLRGLAESDAELSDGLRAGILEHYDAAISSFEAAEAAVADAASFGRQRAGIDRLVAALRAELDRPDPPLPTAPFEGFSVEQADGVLARERSRLAAYRTALREVEQLAEQRAQTRNEISRQLGELDQEIESIGDELRTASQREVHPEEKRAVRAHLIARRQRASNRIDALRAQLAFLDARGTLIPWKIDQAQRRVDHSEALVALLSDATQGLRRKEVARSLEKASELCLRASDSSPVLVDLAGDTEELARLMWGPEGAVVRSAAASRAIVRTRKHTADINRMIQLTRRKFDAFGHRGSLARWWPEVPEGFPLPGDTEKVLRRIERELPEVQHKQIRFEQQRSSVRKETEETMVRLVEEHGEPLDRELVRLTQNLATTRRELLDDLIQIYGRYSNQLTELSSLSKHFVAEGLMVQDFLFERLLWVRSVPRPLIPRVTDTGEALGWMFSGTRTVAVVSALTAGLWARPGLLLVIALAFTVLIGLRVPLRGQLKRLAQRVAEPETDSAWASVSAFGYSLLLAAPFPLACWLASAILRRGDSTAYVYSASEALYYLASIGGVLALSRQLLAPHGLAEAHFGWNPRITRPIHRGLLWRAIVFVPLIYTSIYLGMAGMKMDSPEALQRYNNSLGRIAFIVSLAFIGLSLASLFRPRRHEGASGSAPTDWRRERLYLYTYPVLVLTTAIPAVLAALGYYITGFLLAFLMLRTIWLILLLVVFAGLLQRWINVSRAVTDADGAASAVATAPTELASADAQAKQLFRFAVILAGAVGVWGIWSEANPTLQIMKRVQIFPKIQMIESVDEVETAAGSSAGSSGSTDGAGSSEASTKSAVPGLPLPDTSAVAGSEGAPGQPMTLWHLFEAILAVMITVMLVKNIPGLIELTLRRRTSLDSGARIAFATLMRYVLLMVGISATFSLLGISWSKIQWLAAALTFGLGFGLQEIVANFVSGLILLTERPVRVGDAVTIGNLQGRVSRIRIRATTIALWDQSEMIVPNKEFITTKLINWTLSDSRRRVDIPVRVAYGADLQEVKETLVAVASEHPDVLKDPPPQALLLDFGTDANRFELRYFVDFGEGLRTRDELHLKIDRAFREHGIAFALPGLSIRLPDHSPGEAPAGLPRSPKPGAD